MKSFLVIGPLLAYGLHAQEATTLSLGEAVRLALEKNPSLLAAAQGVAADHAKADAARTELYPSLAFYGGYNRLEEGDFRLSTTNLPQPITVGGVVTDNYLLRVGLRQPLFTGFRLSNLADAASLRALASTEDQAMLEQNLIYRVTYLYWSLYQSRRNADLSSENVRRLETYLEDTRRLEQAGLATRNDLLRVEVQLSNSRIAEIEARNNSSLLEMEFNSVLGRNVDSPVELSSVPASDPGQAYVGEAPDTLFAEAGQRRPDLLAAGTRLEAADAGVAAAKGEWWPQIELTANYQYNNPNSRYQPITPEFLGTWDVGVSLFLNIWNWGATANRVEEAEARRRQTELQREQLARDAATEIRRSQLNLARSREKLSVAALTIQQAEENLRGMHEKYRNGLATSTELLDAEVDLLTAQFKLSAVQVEAELALADLRRSVGLGPSEEDFRE